MTKAREQLAGSHREPVQGSTCLGPCDPGQTLHVVVTVRRRAEQALDQTVQKMASGEAQEPLTREAFADRFGAAADDLAKVEAFANDYGLRVAKRDAAAAAVTLEGTVERFQQAFGVKLAHYEHPELGQFRGRVGSVSVPQELSGVVTAVLGLDDRPQARPHFRMHPVSPIGPRRAAPDTAGFTPLQLAELYDFPSDSTGSGQCIGIIELGGGYTDSDLKQYFNELGLATSPQVVSVAVGGGRNAPTGDPSGPDGEVTLDIEIAGAVAPGAKIAVYFAPNSDAGFIAAVKQAVHDTKNKPSVISISWGAPESSWTAQALSQFDQALKDAAALGVTVCAASGDSGSSDESASGDVVDFPASSQYALACGGTRLVARGASGGTGASIEKEVVWNDGPSGGATGGGVSAQFPVPAWQAELKVLRSDGSAHTLTGRGVPDVAADASPGTGYRVLVAGQTAVVGGTSAVAPLFAGLIARINAGRARPVGFLQPKLYSNPDAFHDITQGNNGTFAAARGWDACTGLGSPDGRKIATVVSGTGKA
jgi:kumamolisin